jgi:hypothetical protein
VQDLAPTGNALYWLVPTPPGSADPVAVTPVRYDLASGHMTDGTSVTGVVGASDLTDTGGWVWDAFGEDAGALVEQLDPATLVVHSERVLPATDAVQASPYAPVLTATVGGPLWIADGSDIWALNPSTGAIETWFGAGDQIIDMSTAPDGSLLYTSGTVADDGSFIVTEYDARTGAQLDRSDRVDAAGPGTVSATNGGVWLSYRTGMAGPALELSSATLRAVAPPSTAGGPFGTFYRIMGVGSGVSEDVLWLTGVNELTCADPRTSVVRAGEQTNVSDPIAIGGRLYALPPSGGVVAMTPPRACFGP